MYMENNNSDQSFKEFNQAPDNYLVWAILSTLFCCLPFGIVSIVKSANVNTYWLQGKYEQAYKASADAKKFAIISASISLVGVALYVIFFIFLGFAGIWNQAN